MTHRITFGQILQSLAVAAALWLSVGVADHANAQALRCTDRETMVSALTNKFKETRQGIGLVSNRRILELYVSDIGSWTVVFSSPDGISCIGAAGKHWQTLSPDTDNKRPPQVDVPAY